jgi:predicted DNA-binding transcriptional regulator YafY
MAYKHDYDKILTRLTVILSKLNDGEALSVKELAEEFNTSVRTIQRDFNERLVSFPIYQENKKWKMQDGYKIEKSASIEDEIVLDIIEKITEGIGGKFAAQSQKLLSKIKNEDFNPIYAKLNIEDISDKLKEIQVLESAIKSKTETHCTYNDERHPPYTTTIQPLKIANFEGFWYLLAMRGDTLKKYYLKNISNCSILENRFEVDESIDKLLDDAISIWFQQDNEPFEVKLFADKYAAKYFQRRALPTQYIESKNSDGSMEFSVKVTHEMELLPLIKYWIPHLHVIEPKWIREMIEKDITSYKEDMKQFKN